MVAKSFLFVFRIISLAFSYDIAHSLSVSGCFWACLGFGFWAWAAAVLPHCEGVWRPGAAAVSRIAGVLGGFAAFGVHLLPF